MKARKPTRWLMLYNGTDLSKWAVNAENLKVEGDALVFSGKSVRAEVGGMSWDNYVLSAEVKITPRNKTPRFKVQLTGSGTAIYCQIVPWCILIAYACDKPKRNPKGFTHLIAPAPVPAMLRKWFTFQIKAEGGTLTAILNSKAIAYAKIPTGTRGMPGFVVNQPRGCFVRLRQIRIKFLDPTRKQLQEFECDAATNWARYEAALKGLNQ